MVVNIKGTKSELCQLWPWTYVCKMIRVDYYNADEFWEQQPYGTRLYYGDGIADYLHRDVLRAAVKLLAANAGGNRHE